VTAFVLDPQGVLYLVLRDDATAQEHLADLQPVLCLCMLFSLLGHLEFIVMRSS
jgi:hypothetical protein